MIITIGRQIGSGGLEIGREVAKRMGIGFYDKELLAEAANRSGLCPDCFARVDEHVQKSYNGVGLFGMRFPFLSDPASVQPSTLSPENIFLVQSEVMNSIANEGDALFVGRCADYVLRARQDLLSVFISASLDDRVARVARRNGCSADEALGIVRRTDKQRAAYYDYFANKTWGAASSYDLCLNSSRFSVGEIVEIIVKCAHSKLK